MANDMASLERAKAIISGLTMVPAVGDIYRNCEIKSMAPYGAFVEIAPGREGLCHISELSAEWLAKPEDAFKIGDRIDVKLIEVNEKGQLRLSVRALLPESESDKDSQKPLPTGDSTKDKGSPRKYVNTSSKVRAATGASKVASGDELVWKKKDVRRASVGDKPMKCNSSSNEEERSSLVNGEATIS